MYSNNLFFNSKDYSNFIFSVKVHLEVDSSVEFSFELLSFPLFLHYSILIIIFFFLLILLIRFKYIHKKREKIN
jgi:hypothetical protein